MRLATFEYRGAVRGGVVHNDTVVPLPEGWSVLHLVREGLPALLERASYAVSTGTPLALAEVRLLPPLEPPALRDFVAFERHVEGVVRSVSGGAGIVPEWYEAPAFYFSNPHALVGAHDDIPVPPDCSLLDFELEVAAIIGSGGSNFDAATAHRSIVGYAILNDWSARDLQRREMRVGLGPAKGKDFASTLGPWLVTADEFESRHDADGFLELDMEVFINGGRIGRDRLSNMAWPFSELIAYASRGSFVRAGDVFGSGTCGNGGCLAELWGRNETQLPPPLAPGDVVTMTVEGIGTISNRVVLGTPAPPVRRARVRSSPGV